MHIAQCQYCHRSFIFDMKLTHRQIEVFRAVMQTGHVTRAAERLHTSQPTVSRELARLEQVTGLPCSTAQGAPAATARALALLEEVELSYVGLERIAATALGLRSWAQGRLQVACLPALAHALLPEALRAWPLQVPEAAVGLTPLDSPQLEAALSEQRFDLGLSERLEAPGRLRLEHLLVADEVAVLPAGHRLAARGRWRRPISKARPSSAWPRRPLSPAGGRLVRSKALASGATCGWRRPARCRCVPWSARGWGWASSTR
jgi:DNA-binding transcriptional LysR family regulator